MLVALWIGICSSAIGAQRDMVGSLYRFEKAPSWVSVANPDYDAPTPPGDQPDGAWFLMFDRQINVTAQGNDRYTHEAIKVVAADGIKTQSDIDFEVDPSFETLVIHSLHLVRGGKVIDERNLARFTTLPEETHLEEHIFNGGYRVNVVLADVRVGDVIEYESTVRTRDLMFPGHFALTTEVAWEVPVLWQRLKLRYPAARDVHYRLSDSAAPPPEVRQDGDIKSISFNWQNQVVINPDKDAPGWYQQYPTFYASDITSWADVEHRLDAYYRLGDQPRPQLDAVVASINAAGGTPEQKALRALQFVQESVRYTSISIGRGSQVPNDPETVLKRRFGDCKDKSLLLVTMLGKLGINARPALVNSQFGPALPQYLPTPFAFDHAIVRAQIGSVVYWFDGTASKQHSALPFLSSPGFAFALVIDAGVSGLEVIPAPKSDESLRDIRMSFDFRSGFDKPAKLDVVTLYVGDEADSMRASLSRQTMAQRDANYVNYYARYYPGIHSIQPISLNDDLVGNKLEVTEHYAINNPSVVVDDKKKIEIYTDELYRYGNALEASVRHSPLAIDYPDHVKQSMAVYMPDERTLKHELTTIENPAFVYRSEVGHDGQRYFMSYEYQALADHVDVGALAQYEQDRAKILKDIDFSFTDSLKAGPAAPFALAPLPFFAFLVSSLLGIYFARTILLKYDPPPLPVAPGSVAGIRGWLVIPALGVFIQPLVHLVVLIPLFRLMDSGVWQRLPSMAEVAYGDSVQPILLGIFFMAGIIQVLTVVVAILFFKKRTSAPLLYIVSIWSITLFTSVVVVFSSSVLADKSLYGGGVYADIIRSVLASSCWTAYMLRSRRVRATFLNRHAVA
jgi:transglutaminase-like putative cysteine protease